MFGKVRANVSLSRGLVYIVLLAEENEFPLKTRDKTAGLGLMGKRKTFFFVAAEFRSHRRVVYFQRLIIFPRRSV